MTAIVLAWLAIVMKNGCRFCPGVSPRRQEAGSGAGGTEERGASGTGPVSRGFMKMHRDVLVDTDKRIEPGQKIVKWLQSHTRQQQADNDSGEMMTISFSWCFPMTYFLS